MEEFNIIGLDIIDALSIYQFEDTEFEAGVATLEGATTCGLHWLQSYG